MYDFFFKLEEIVNIREKIGTTSILKEINATF